MPVIAGVLLSGCLSGRNGLVLDRVGPSDQPAETGSSAGLLVVYSAYDLNASFMDRNSRERVHSDYELFAGNGQLLQRVHNNTGTLLQDPVTVVLPPGKYIVVARANGYGRVTVPVAVQKKKVTILHLEGGGFWPDESAFNQTNAVRLPDGVIVGWRNDL